MSKDYIERDVLIATFNDTNWYSINKKGELTIGASDEDTAWCESDLEENE